MATLYAIRRWEAGPAAVNTDIAGIPINFVKILIFPFLAEN